MALKRVGKLNGYHLPTFGREYKSFYWLESRHWDLSSDATKFSYWHMKGNFLKAKFYIYTWRSIFFLETLSESKNIVYIHCKK